MPQSVERTAEQLRELLTGIPGGGSQSLEVAFEAIRDALAASLSGGADRLALTNYLSIGADPAQSGALRLAQGGAITSRNAAGNADITWWETDTIVDGLTYDVMRMGAGLIVIDPFDTYQMVITSSMYLMVTQAADVQDWYNAYYAQLQYTGLVAESPGVASLSLSISSQTEVEFKVVGLPQSDPNVTGKVYTMDDAGLAAELAAGSRYLLISNGP